VRLSFLVVALPLLGILSATAFAYDKATDSDEVVMNKLFPKKSRVELDGDFGVVLNSSFVQTELASVGLTYFWSENWGFNVTGDYAITQDKPERTCIENFYNDPNYALTGLQCGDASNLSQDPAGDANMGPAYMPIRQLQYMAEVNFVWNPIYGKQIVLLSATNYFDFYIDLGGGLAMSQFYPKQTNFPDTGLPQRGQFCVKADAAANRCNTAAQNPGTTDPNKYGIPGRPAPQSESNVMIHLAIGQRFHFFKRFEVLGSLENYTLVGTEAGFDNFLAIKGGLGMRF
jgi:outer membrane beta-barrel protein